jgi:hypothetical protein
VPLEWHGRAFARSNRDAMSGRFLGLLVIIIVTVIGTDDRIWFRVLVVFDVLFTLLAFALVEIVLVG